MVTIYEKAKSDNNWVFHFLIHITFELGHQTRCKYMKISASFAFRKWKTLNES